MFVPRWPACQCVRGVETDMLVGFGISSGLKRHIVSPGAGMNMKRIRDASTYVQRAEGE